MSNNNQLKPFCSNCNFVVGSKEYNDCCENRIYWTEKFDSIKDTLWFKEGLKPLGRLKP